MTLDLLLIAAVGLAVVHLDIFMLLLEEVSCLGFGM